MAQPAVSAFPTPPSSTDPANFNDRADAFLGHFPTFVTEVSAYVAFLAASAQPVAITVPYTFSTTTTDSDPGAGTLRLGSATQNTATVIRADLADSSGATVTTILDAFDDSTSTVKGFLRLTAVGDGTKWLLFTVSAVASPTGYRNITVAPVASSATNPFANGDAISLTFVRNGDKGDTGPPADIGPHAMYEEQRASGAGSLTTRLNPGNTTIALNTEVFDTLGAFALNGNDIDFLQAGTYWLLGEVQAIGTGGIQANLYNVTDTTNIKAGISGAAIDLGSGYYTYGFSTVATRITISGPKTIRLCAYMSQQAAADSMGRPVTSGLGEVFSRLTIAKIS